MFKLKIDTVNINIKQIIRIIIIPNKQSNVNEFKKLSILFET